MAELDLEIKAEFSEALKQLTQFAEQSSKSLKTIEDEFSDLSSTGKKSFKEIADSSSTFSSSLKAVGAAAAGILTFFTGREIVQFFEKATEAASEQEDAIKKLNVSLALNGDFTQEASKHFQDFASAMQESVGVGDDAVLNLVALSKSFGATNEQAERIVKTAFDFAAVTGDNVESAVSDLTKTINGFKGGLGRTVKEINGMTEAQLQQGEALNLIEKRYAGAAKALSDTFSGSLKIAKSNFGELLETIGQAVTENPFLIQAFNQTSLALKNLNQFLIENKKGFLDLTTGAIKSLLDSLPAIIGGFQNVVIAFKSISAALDLGKIGFVAFGKAAIDVLGPVVQAIGQVINLGLSPFLKAIDAIGGGLNSLGIISDDSVERLQQFTDLDFTVSTDSILELRDGIDQIGKDATQSFADTYRSINTTNATFNTLAETTQKYVDTIKVSSEETGKADQFLQNLNNSASKTKINYEELAKSVKDTTEKLSDLRKDLQKEDDKKNPVLAEVRIQDERLKVVQNALDKQLINEVESQDLINQIRLTSVKNIEDEVDKIKKEGLEKEKKRQEDFLNDLKKRTTEAAKSPLLTPGEATSITGGPQEGSSLSQNAETLSRVAGLVDASLKGAQGATVLISNFASNLVDSILPGLGDTIGSIVNVLAQGPDKVKELVQGFVKALPEVVTNIAQAIPVIIETLASNADEIILSLVKSTPALIRALINALPLVVVELAKAIPEIVKGLIAEIRDEFSSSNIRENLTESGRAFNENIVDAARKWHDSTDKAGQDISTASKTFGLQIANAGQNFVTSLQGFLSSLGESISKLVSGFGDVGTVFASSITGAGESLVTGLLSLPSQIEQGLLGIFDRLSIKLPEFKFPSFPTFSFPPFPVLPAFPPFPSLPAFPAFPKFTFPDFPPFPKLPVFKFPDYPAFKFPALPTFKFPSLPELKIPKLDFEISIPPIEIPSFEINIPGLDKLKSLGGTTSAKIKNAIGLAGGGEIPSGFPNDSFGPLFLQSGENVMTSELNDRLARFLDRADNQGQSAPTKVVLQVGEKELANVMLNLNRQGFRLA